MKPSLLPEVQQAAGRSPGGAYDVFAGCLRDVFRSIVAAAPTHSRRASAAARIAHRAPPGEPSEHPRRRHSRSPRASGSRRCLRAVRLRTNLGTVDLAATLPSPRMSVANKNCPPRASGTSSGSFARLRRPIHLALPVPMTTSLFRLPSGPPSGSPPDHPRACIDPVHRHHRDVLGLIRATAFASIGKLGTRSRRRRAR